MTAWYVVATLVYNGKFSLQTPDDPDGTWYLYVATPATLIYLLYHTVLEIVMRGRTPGKRMAGIRIVARNGSSPGIAAQLVRNVFRLIDSFPVGYGVGLFTCLVTRDHVRVGDLAAGTLMIYENRNTLAARSLPVASNDRRLDMATLELVGELLERWGTLEPNARARLARSLIERVDGRGAGRVGRRGGAACAARAARRALRARKERRRDRQRAPRHRPPQRSRRPSRPGATRRAAGARGSLEGRRRTRSAGS